MEEFTLSDGKKEVKVIVDGDDEPRDADGTDFGSADIDSVTITNTYTIHNTGNAALTLTGNPVIAVPCGLDETGTPFGFQIAGKPGRTTTNLDAARQHAFARTAGGDAIDQRLEFCACADGMVRQTR